MSVFDFWKKIREFEPQPKGAKLSFRLGFVLIFAATLAAYAPVLRGGLVWNDSDYVTKRELRSVSGLERIWFEVGATEQYYPVLHNAFWLEHRIWGDTPWCYHLLNVLLHATSACLLVLILRRLQVPATWLAGLLFALHPVCVESVAWISEEKNTLSTVFYLLAALVYLRWKEGGHAVTSRSAPHLYLLAFGCFILALLSKSVTATLPAALLVILWWRQGRLFWKRDIVPLIPWFVLGAAVGLFTGWVERTYIIGGGSAEFALNPVSRCLVAGRAIWFYLGKLLWPHPLIFFYPRWRIDPAAPWQYLYPLAALGVLAGLWLIRKRGRTPLAVALLFIGSLFPTLGFLNVYAFRFSFVADHFEYLACLAPMSAAAVLCSRLAQTARILISSLLLGVLALLTFAQGFKYHDLDTLYCATLADNPDSWIAHNNLGNSLLAQHRFEEAIAHYRAALAVRSDLAETENNLGAALYDLGRPEEAAAHYQTALRIKPDYPEAEYNIGNLMRDAGRREEAAEHYQAALRMGPKFSAAEFSFGQLLQGEGRLQDAIAHYQAALVIEPDYPEAENNLALALADLGRPQEAIAHYERALRIRPDYAAADYNLGLALRATGRTLAAVARLAEAERLQPDYADAWNVSGICLSELGRPQEAIACYEQAVRIRPDYAGALNNLGGMLLSLGRTEEAIARLEQSLRLEAGNPDAHYNLGMALQAVGREDEAIAQFREVLRLRPDYAPALLKLETLFRPR
jgi:tetratricopeptide (TPR) repeat protein